MNKSNNPIILIALAFALVIGGASIGRAAKPDIPSEVTDAVAVIKKNQPILADNREAHQKFDDAKASNKEQIIIMRKHGYDLDWNTLEPIPFQ